LTEFPALNRYAGGIAALVQRLPASGLNHVEGGTSALHAPEPLRSGLVHPEIPAISGSDRFQDLPRRLSSRG